MKERGTTLVEALVSLAVVSVVVLAAVSLVAQSARVFESAGRTMRDPGCMLAGAWLRRDIHSAQSIQVESGVWSSESLVLGGGGGEVIVYECEGARLLRRRFARDGKEIDHRTVLQGLLRWRWRAATSRVVEVEFTLSTHVDPTVASEFADHSRLGEMTLRQEIYVFALRGGGGTW